MAVVTANKFAREAMTKRRRENVGEIVETIQLEPHESLSLKVFFMKFQHVRFKMNLSW